MTALNRRSLLTLSLLLFVVTADAIGTGDLGQAVHESRARKPAFKGVEMYSWQVHGAWKFSLLLGTNRNKTRREVTLSSVSITGVTGLKKGLARLAEGEEVFWFNLEGEPFAYPPVPVIRDLEDFCKGKGIKLVVRNDQILRQPEPLVRGDPYLGNRLRMDRNDGYDGDENCEERRLYGHTDRTDVVWKMLD